MQIEPTQYESSTVTGPSVHRVALPALRTLKVHFRPSFGRDCQLVNVLLHYPITTLELAMHRASTSPDAFAEGVHNVFRTINCTRMRSIERLRIDTEDALWLNDRNVRQEFEAMLFSLERLRDVDFPLYILSPKMVSQLLCLRSVRNIRTRDSVLPTPTDSGLWPQERVWHNISQAGSIQDPLCVYVNGALETRILTICSPLPSLIRGLTEQMPDNCLSKLKVFRVVVPWWADIHPDQVFTLFNTIGRLCPSIEHIHIDNVYHRTTLVPQALPPTEVLRIEARHLSPLANLPELKSLGLFWPWTLSVSDDELLHFAPRFAKLTRLVLEHPFARSAYPEEPTPLTLVTLAILSMNCPHLVELSISVSLTVSYTQAAQAVLPRAPLAVREFRKLRILELGMQFPLPWPNEVEPSARLLFDILPSECEIRTTQLHVADKFPELWAGTVSNYQSQAYWKSASAKMLFIWRMIYGIMQQMELDVGKQCARWAEDHEPWKLQVGEDIFPSMF